MRLLVILLALVAVTGTVHAQSACPPKTGTKYKVKIDSAPQGATIYVGDKTCGAVGSTPWAGTLPAGSYTVILEVADYEPSSRPFKVGRLRTVQELFIPMVKKAVPPKIDVRADADKNVVGAIVSLDGQPQGPAPVVLNTKSGRHLLEIKKDGFETYTQWVEAVDNQIVTVPVVLKEI